MMSRYQVLLFALFGIITLINGHSQMRCAKWDPVAGKCNAPIRDQGESFTEEGYLYDTGPICQAPMTNPISASYANGVGCPDYDECPDPMGTFASGETFNVMWFARNHAATDQAPATVRMYLSPKETSNQGSDVSSATFLSNMICSGPFMNCNGQNGDQIKCTLSCTMPTLADGIYTLLWKWDWQGSVYTTCADINLSGTTGASGSSGTAVTTGTGSGSGSGSSTTSVASGVTPVTTKARPTTKAPRATTAAAGSGGSSTTGDDGSIDGTTQSRPTTSRPLLVTTMIPGNGEHSSANTLFISLFLLIIVSLML